MPAASRSTADAAHAGETCGCGLGLACARHGWQAGRHHKTFAAFFFAGLSERMFFKLRVSKAGKIMKTNTFDEAALVERLGSGDRVAFESVYRKHNAAMVRMCTGIVRNRATAEEVVQDTWVAVLKGISGFEGRSSLAGWIFAILVNKARSRAGRDGRMVSFDGGGEGDNLAAAFDGRGRWKDMPELWETLTPERIVAGRSVMAHVTAAIESLPLAQRSVMVLRGQQQLEPAEVCATLGITEGNMRVLLHRARLSVRKVLDAVIADAPV